MPRPSRSLWIYFGLLAVVIAVYWQTGSHDFLNYDDPDYYTGNAHVRAGLTMEGIRWAFTSSYAANWIPLTWISHMADFQFFGAVSGPPHLINVALHAASTLLLFALLKRATGAIGRSAFVACLFAIHPLHMESVAWIAERKDVLYGLFWMLSLYAYARYAEKPSAARYTIVALLFCAGLMSKPMMLTFPLIALLLDVWPLQRFSRRAVLEKAPLLLLSAAVAAITLLAQKGAGAVVATDQIPIAARIGNAFVSYVLYLRDLIWPANLAVFYPYIERPAWFTLAAALSILVVTFYAALQLRHRPYFFAGWFWYVLTLLPVIGIIQAGAQSRADRYTYIPLIGVSIVIAWGAAELLPKPILLPAGVALCAIFAGVTWVDLPYWRDSVTLFTHAIDVTSSNYIAYNNLGGALRQQGRIAEAVDNFRHAVAIRPDDALAQDSLGEGLTAAGAVDEAVEHLRESVRLNPTFVKARVDLGSALLRAGQITPAAEQYEAAVQMDPSDASAQYGLGGVLSMEGRPADAQAHLRLGLPFLIAQIEMNPDWVDGHFNLGNIYGLLGRADDAAREFAQVIRLRPEDAEAHLNLGTALTTLGRRADAAREYQEALRLNPSLDAARRALDALNRQ